ncbi:hypothetical protein [Pantoea ananatis]|uniref:hypothetical protein n=1 Tax=Pantoea ananas TaxID=553 RepID=UPI001B30C801|nr:hypothetical protein [Pantoea ananatis]
MASAKVLSSISISLKFFYDYNEIDGHSHIMSLQQQDPTSRDLVSIFRKNHRLKENLKGNKMITTLFQVAATLIGLTGTLIMFFNSYSLLPYEGATFGSDEIIEHNRKVRIKNQRMLVRQKIGIGLLTFSFLVQLISYAL